MTDSYKPLLKGIIARLKAVTAITDIVSTRVYSDVPQNATFPYIVVTIDSLPFDGCEFTGMEHEVQIQSFSRTGSPAQSADIRAAVYTALNRQESNITMDSGSVRVLQYNGVGFVEREPDGKTWQSLSRFRCVVT